MTEEFSDVIILSRFQVIYVLSAAHSPVERHAWEHAGLILYQQNLRSPLGFHVLFLCFQCHVSVPEARPLGTSRWRAYGKQRNVNLKYMEQFKISCT